MEQLEEQRRLDCDQKALATEEKLEAARLRRYQKSSGTGVSLLLD